MLQFQKYIQEELKINYLEFENIFKNIFQRKIDSKEIIYKFN
jgi:hypothetical protein